MEHLQLYKNLRKAKIMNAEWYSMYVLTVEEPVIQILTFKTDVPGVPGLLNVYHYFVG